ncbi:MAG: hypothetical protein SCJ94_02270 [Bacillota bacterium]|nr:hypothetical protein [Bacillota bacterium]
MFKNIKPLMAIIGISILAFVFVIAYWTVIPRTGTVEIPGEGLYVGELRGMTFHGYGNWTSYELRNTSYEGQWEKGLYHGSGTLTFHDGSQIMGQFNEGYLIGEGVSISAKGEVKRVDFDEINAIQNCLSCDHDH